MTLQTSPSPAGTPPPQPHSKNSASRGLTLTAWALAVCLALVAAWSWQQFATSQAELAALRDEQAFAAVALKSARQQLEAERILTSRRVEGLEQQIAEMTSSLAEAKREFTSAMANTGATTDQLTERERQLGDLRAQFGATRTQLAGAHERIAEGERQIAALTQRIESLTGTAADVRREFEAAQQEIAKLTAEMNAQRLENYKITMLATTARGRPQAQAVAVWDPVRQEGVLNAANLPALPPNQDYQLWVIDPEYPNPLDGGVFTVAPRTGEARVPFKAKQRVTAIAAVVVSRERKGGAAQPEGEFVLRGK